MPFPKRRRSKRIQRRESQMDDVDSGDEGGRMPTVEADIGGKFLSEQLDLLADKKLQSRLEALAKTNHRLTERPLLNVEPYVATIGANVSKLLAKGSVEEVHDAARLVCLCAIMLGQPKRGQLTNAILPTLTELASTAEGAVETRAAALTALGFCHLLGADFKDCQPAMSLCKTLWTVKKLEPPVLSAAVNSWTLMLCGHAANNQTTLASLFSRENIRLLSGLLQHEDLEVRQAAGECLAVLSGGSKQKALEEFLGVFEELATDSDRQKGKKDKRAQKSTFRAILKTVKDGEEPKEVLIVQRVRHILS
eukprot:g81350.t1